MPAENERSCPEKVGILPGPREQAAFVRGVDANGYGDLHDPMTFPLAFVLFPKKTRSKNTWSGGIDPERTGPAPRFELCWPVALAILGVIGLLSLLLWRIRLFPGYVP
jgi:hypothetical protein